MTQSMLLVSTNYVVCVCWRVSLWVGSTFVQFAGKLFMLGAAIMKN